MVLEGPDYADLQRTSEHSSSQKALKTGLDFRTNVKNRATYITPGLYAESLKIHHDPTVF